MPHDRLFGPTYGLDHRLFAGEKLRPEVRHAVLTKFDAFCARHNWPHWHQWAKVIFFGSEASEWTSPELEGNADFDLSIGLHYPRLRHVVPAFENTGDAEIAHRVTELLHAECNDPHAYFSTGEGATGPWDQTWFANQLGYMIKQIKPYAAYDVYLDAWVVRPPHLPDWDIHHFPQGEGLVTEIQGVIEMARGALAMAEPYRTKAAAELWHFIHDTRANAFGPQGEGWYGTENVLEKALDQEGLMQPLWEAMTRHREHPEDYAPQRWSNTPAMAH